MKSLLNTRRFDPPISTSNLVQPDRKTLKGYARSVYQGDPVIEWLETRLAAFHHTSHAITLCSGFWSLVLAIRALAMPGRTDLLMPSLTYRRMADVAAWAGLRPRFCEVDPGSLAATADTMRAALAPEVGLLLAVHPIVGLCDVEGLMALARDTEIPLLFDSVESVYEHAPSGKIGRFGAAECFSLHASKLLNGCEGGYITTKDPALAQRLSQLRDGTAPDGMDLRLNRFHAAMALAALDGLDDQVCRNRNRYDAYRVGLSNIPGLRLLPFDLESPSSCKTIVVELEAHWPCTRMQTLDALHALNVLARPYYHPPLHQKRMSYPHVAATLHDTDALAERFMLLPCGDHVTLDDIADVLHILREIGT
jgi:dTDP-4-amino-4,6-dideoxygalactose transaminase